MITAHRAVVLLVAIGVAVGLAGCSQARLDQAKWAGSSALAEASKAAAAARTAVQEEGGKAAAAAVAMAAQKALTKAGVTLTKAPVCTPRTTADVGSLSVSGTVMCKATTTTKQPVVITFTGIVSAKSCNGSFVVTVAGKPKIHTPSLAACSLASLLD